ncbi:repressor LexA [candidate division WWE3 bacterium RIFCSPHIGHO2_01_FULL_40_23]|uniref:Repressor LexA n=1 Tax=candidate division WWE3 bacterium RIFCSPLOWO2_01_FULL_41_18 TaxID=1802625 RepID=A0A1F4VCR6_UNCKA|nr:MAG: repressor LexA [candidate division WWE3 bacterium RIFCSPHIGHO2_01_FULL_40_23]OGC55036.1 MAG: repressor LexA [candidate division WWE3 bacterium RIFCSPLOWO2_01_FULL_41_18]
MNKLSKDAAQAFAFIRMKMNTAGAAPTINEISTYLSVSTRATLDALRELEDNLVIKRSPYRTRSIEILAEVDGDTGVVKENTVSIPILGTAPGGAFLFAEQNYEGEICLPSRLLRGKDSQNTFLLRVTGNSMKPYLEDGDLALVKKQETANRGDIVVAVVREDSGGYEATIKEFQTDTSGKIVLNPLNTKEYKPFVLTDQEVGIQGVVVGAIKDFS